MKLLALLTLILAGLLSGRTARAAPPAQPATHNYGTLSGLHWTICQVHLDWARASSVTEKDCWHVAMKPRSSAPTGHSHTRTVSSGGHLVTIVSYPIFAPPVPTLAGCGAAIRQWAGPIARASQLTGVPIWAITGVIGAESGGSAYVPTTPDGRGGPGDIGLMQYGTAEAGLVVARFGFGAWTSDPATNILTGSGYLRILFDEYSGHDWPTAIHHYNGGPAGWGNPAYLPTVLSWSCS